MYPFLIDGKLVYYDELHEYIGESFNLSETKYGTNIEIGHIFDNGAIQNDIKEFHTFFRFNAHDYIVTVSLRKDNYWEFTYASSIFESEPTNIPEEYTLKKWYSNDALSVLNRVLYIFGSIVKEYNLTNFKFGALDDKIHRMYSHMINNASFKNLIDILGFRLIAIDSEYWYFYKNTINKY